MLQLHFTLAGLSIRPTVPKSTLLTKPYQIVLIGRHGEEVRVLGFLPDAIYCPAHNRLMAHWLQTGSKKRLLQLMRAVCEKKVERGRPEESSEDGERETEKHHRVKERGKADGM